MEMDPRLAQRVKDMLRGFNGHMGIRLVAASPECFEIEADLRPELLNSDGIAHGGVLFTLCDAVCGFLARLDGRPTVTQSANIYYLRPGRGSRLRAIGRSIKVGRSTGLYEAQVFDENGKLLAQGTVSMFFFAQPDKSVPGK